MAKFSLVYGLILLLVTSYYSLRNSEDYKSVYLDASQAFKYTEITIDKLNSEIKESIDIVVDQEPYEGHFELLNSAVSVIKATNEYCKNINILKQELINDYGLIEGGSIQHPSIIKRSGILKSELGCKLFKREVQLIKVLKENNSLLSNRISKSWVGTTNYYVEINNEIKDFENDSLLYFYLSRRQNSNSLYKIYSLLDNRKVRAKYLLSKMLIINNTCNNGTWRWFVPADRPSIFTSKKYLELGDSIYNQICITQGIHFDNGPCYLPTSVLHFINGKSVISINGVGKYTVIPDKLGTHNLNIETTYDDPITTGRMIIKTYYQYEVIEPHINISTNNLNVLYIGIDNPITVSVPGVNKKDVRVAISGGNGNLKKLDDNKFLAYVTNIPKPGESCYITVDVENISEKVPFKIKYLPDPFAVLNEKYSQSIPASIFKNQKALKAIIKDMDLSAPCKVTSFDLVRIPKRKDEIKEFNQGALFNIKCLELINHCKPGDIYYFDSIKAKCPGDIKDRTLNPLVFTIK